MSAAPLPRVLVTGAAGSLGRTICPGLEAAGWQVHAADLAVPEDASSHVWHVVDCTDSDAVDQLVGRVRPGAVVHLAGVPGELPLEGSLRSHVLSTGALLDALVTHGVPRFVYAGSNHAVGRTPRSLPVDTRTLPRPDSFYGVAKVAAEALMHLYADRHGLDVVSARIGSFLPRPTTRRHLATWLSPDDAVRMTQAALTAPGPGFAVLYGISANTRAWWDLEAGRALGYDPADDAEAWAAEIEAEPESADDRHEAAYVGGPFVT